MVCFIILHYNVYEETIKCVDSILHNIMEDKKIIIVDNCSSNNSFEKLLEYYNGNTNVDILKTESNLGFANGNNFGYHYAKKNYEFDFCIVMNNDMEILQKDFITKIYEKYFNDKFDILGPDIYSTKVKRHQNPQAYKNYTLKELKKFMKILFLRNKFKHVFFLLSSIKNMLIKPKVSGNIEVGNEIEGVPLHGSCYVFSKNFINKHSDCFYNKTFMYQESYILHFLATKNNEKIIYFPEIQVLHHEDVSTDSVYKKRYSKYTFINKCLYDSTRVFIDLMMEYEQK